MLTILVLFFFFKQKTAYEMRISDWSSDVCSSDLAYSCSDRDVWRRERVRHLLYRARPRLVQALCRGVPVLRRAIRGRGLHQSSNGPDLACVNRFVFPHRYRNVPATDPANARCDSASPDRGKPSADSSPHPARQDDGEGK